MDGSPPINFIPPT
ncbi:unnamed protein product, partial [Rotaria sordida]